MLHFLLILLISPAFGKPSSDQLNVETDISNHLDNLVKFSHDTGKLLNNSKLFEKVSETLHKADESVREMEVILNDLQSKIPALRDQGNYFPGYIKAKSFLRQTRHELRELAHRTVTEVENLKILLDDLDNGKDAIFLTFTIQSMKSLMDETQEKLDKAKNKYNEARIAFDNLRSSVEVQHEVLRKDVLQKESKQVQFQEDKEYTEKVRSVCKIVSWLTFGLCSIIHHFVNEIPLEAARVQLENLSAITPEFLEKANALTQDINDAIGAINVEIKQINRWAASAERVSRNINDYPEESLREYELMRTYFRNGLDDLKKNAETFLAVQNSIF